MKYCSNCGSKLPEDAEFCTECGQRANSALQPQAQAKPKKKWCPGKIILTIIGVICVLGIAYFYGDSELLFSTGSFLFRTVFAG